MIPDSVPVDLSCELTYRDLAMYAFGCPIEQADPVASVRAAVTERLLRLGTDGCERAYRDAAAQAAGLADLAAHFDRLAWYERQMRRAFPPRRRRRDRTARPLIEVLADED
jgi:hypothetical protein